MKLNLVSHEGEDEVKKKNIDDKTVDVSEKDNNQSKGVNNNKKQWTHATNEVAAINKLLGEPMTDDKALGFIKNLLLKNSPTNKDEKETGN